MDSRARTFVFPGAAVVLSGLVLGIGTQILQGALPDAWNVFANSTAVWAVAAFLIGAAMPTVRSAAIGGALQLVIASCSFYLAVDWFEGVGSNAKSSIVWSLAGIVAGSVFGPAGFVARCSPTWRRPAVALVTGAIGGEGLHLAVFVDNPVLHPAGITELVIAASIAVWCLVGASGRTRAISAAVVLASFGATLIGGALIDLAFSAA